MKSLLREIRQQPPHIRKLFMWTSVVITFSLVGYIGFRQTSQNFVALLNPGDAAKQEEAVPPDPGSSPFALLRDSWESLRASIGGAFNGNDSADTSRERPSVSPVPPQKLPVN